MLNTVDDFYTKFISQTIDIISKFTFNHKDEAISHIFSLLATSVELLDNMCCLSQNESRIGITVLLRSCLEATVDIQFILINRSNFKRLKLENLYHLKYISEASYKNNPYLKHLKQHNEFNTKANNTCVVINEFEKKGIEKASIKLKFKETGFIDEYNSIYSTLCAHSHNSGIALWERHVTSDASSFRINLFKSSKMEDYDHYLGIAVRLIALSVKSINEAFNYGLGADIDHIDNMVNERIAYLNKLGIE